MDPIVQILSEAATIFTIAAIRPSLENDGLMKPRNSSRNQEKCHQVLDEFKKLHILFKK